MGTPMDEESNQCLAVRHLSHGQTVPVVLMTCCLRPARFLSSSATSDSSNDAMANWHVVLDQMELCSVTWVADRTSSCWS